MSKPDPNITANLLASVLGKPAETRADGSQPVKKSHAEAKAIPAAKAMKTTPKKAVAQGHMRSSNRGK